MSDLIELYQETIMDHSQSPRHAGRLDSPTKTLSGKNPLCGDIINLDIVISDDKITDIRCDCSGCAISTAAASIMAEEIIGKDLNAALSTIEMFSKAVKEGSEEFPESSDLNIFCNVAKFPSRIKCATLPWSTLKKALLNV